MNRLVLLAIASLIAINVSGCASPSVFKEGFIVDGKVQEAAASNAAKSSTGILDYASKIYREKPKQTYGDHVVTETSLTEKLDYRLLATDFFRIYCNEKTGILKQWQFNSNATAYSYARGVGRKVIACEKGDGIDSLLLYETDKSDSAALPYETNVIFANGTLLNDFIERNRLYGFESSNGLVTFPMSRIYDPSAKFKYFSDQYAVIFNYENDTNKPVDINLFNSYVTINGSKYTLDFEKGTQGQDVIDWTFYSSDKDSQGVFVGQEGSTSGKLRFNPGQKLNGEFKFRIPGRTEISEKDMADFVFVIDGITCDHFKKIDYFTQNKKSF